VLNCLVYFTGKKIRPLSGETKGAGVEIADDLIFIIGRSIFSGACW